MRLAIDVIRQQIANLILVHPELQEDEDAWMLTLESETEAVELFRQIEQRRQSAAHLAGAIGSNIAELELRQERFERREKAMRELAFKLMQFADIKKLELPEATYSVRNGQQKVIGDADPMNVSLAFRSVEYSIDRKAIKEALKAGQTVTGFTLSNAEPTLAITTK